MTPLVPVLFFLALYAFSKGKTSNRAVRLREIGPVQIMPRRQDVMGSAFGSFYNPRKAASLLALAQKYGPAVAAVYPPAGVALAAVSALQARARDGDPDALAKIAAVRQGAAAGDPKAIAAANLLRAATAARSSEEG